MVVIALIYHTLINFILLTKQEKTHIQFLRGQILCTRIPDEEEVFMLFP